MVLLTDGQLLPRCERFLLNREFYQRRLLSFLDRPRNAAKRGFFGSSGAPLTGSVRCPGNICFGRVLGLRGLRARTGDSSRIVIGWFPKACEDSAPCAPIAIPPVSRVCLPAQEVHRHPAIYREPSESEARRPTFPAALLSHRRSGFADGRGLRACRR
jgi:hypothetical protein